MYVHNLIDVYALDTFVSYLWDYDLIQIVSVMVCALNALMSQCDDLVTSKQGEA